MKYPSIVSPMYPLLIGSMPILIYIPVTLHKVPEKTGDIIPNNYGWTFSETSFFHQTSPDISRYRPLTSNLPWFSWIFTCRRAARRSPVARAHRHSAPASRALRRAAAGRRSAPGGHSWAPAAPGSAEINAVDFVANTIGESVTHMGMDQYLLIPFLGGWILHYP